MRLFKKKCKHENLRCIHGDEVLLTIRGWLRTHIARAHCLDCDSPVYDRELPEICTVTTKPHEKSRRHK